MTEQWKSPFLVERKQALKKIIDLLSSRFGWASILGADTSGFNYEVTGKGYSVKESMWAERGFVARVYNKGRCFEYSFSPFQSGTEEDVASLIIDKSEAAFKNPEGESFCFPDPEEEELIIESGLDPSEDPVRRNPEEIFASLEELKNRLAASSKNIASIKTRYEGVRVSKLFISPKKELFQSYVWSQVYMFLILRRNNINKMIFHSASGLKGPSLINEMTEAVPSLVKDGESLLDSVRMEPGEYEVILSPDIAGLIAHEAFGHGVEMDMFVRGRAKAPDYMGKSVGSEKVTMYDGAAWGKEVASFIFDDEGTPSGDTLVIDKGILKGGISDYLSAKILGTKPTGNGRRESFEKKAYSRMTNTRFASGTNTLEEMISGIKKGYLLNISYSGMEDPKNWGIQGVALMGREIINGQFSGKIVSPVVMTGYVPEVLGKISMVGKDVSLFGSGYCGKGYKEFVKVSAGGPYIKTQMRLG